MCSPCPARTPAAVTTERCPAPAHRRSQSVKPTFPQRRQHHFRFLLQFPPSFGKTFSLRRKGASRLFRAPPSPAAVRHQIALDQFHRQHDLLWLSRRPCGVILFSSMATAWRPGRTARVSVRLNLMVRRIVSTKTARIIMLTSAICVYTCRTICTCSRSSCAASW